MRSARVLFLAVAVGFAVLPSASAQVPGVEGELERVADTTPQEKLEYSSNALEEMRDHVKNVNKLVETARREGQTEQLQCVLNRLTAMRALLQVSEAADASMQSALAGQERERADHEFRKIAVALSKTRQLAAEAERCSSVEGAPSETDTTIVVEGGPDEGDDESDDVVDAFDVPVDPPDASPFM